MWVGDTGVNLCLYFTLGDTETFGQSGKQMRKFF